VQFAAGWRRRFDGRGRYRKPSPVLWRNIQRAAALVRHCALRRKNESREKRRA
jgi:hypothetical protein